MSIGSATASGTGRDWTLWAGMLGAPIAWFAQHVSAYALAPLACSLKNPLLLHLTSLTSLSVAAGAAWAALTGWEAAGRGRATDTREGAAARARLQGLGGLLISGLFLLVIVAEWMAISVLDPCVP